MEGCYNPESYNGDGYLIDKGVAEADWRYILVLDEIELNKAGTYRYTVGKLPRKEFVFGLQLYGEVAVRNLLDNKQGTPRVSIELVGEEGSVIFSAADDLKNLVWSIPSTYYWLFIYYDQNESGSYFTPFKNEKTILTIKVHESNVDLIPHRAKLVAKSSGWK